jgi:hypothetical protein
MYKYSLNSSRFCQFYLFMINKSDWRCVTDFILTWLNKNGWINVRSSVRKHSYLGLDVWWFVGNSDENKRKKILQDKYNLYSYFKTLHLYNSKQLEYCLVLWESCSWSSSIRRRRSQRVCGTFCVQCFKLGLSKSTPSSRRSIPTWRNSERPKPVHPVVLQPVPPLLPLLFSPKIVDFAVISCFGLPKHVIYPWSPILKLEKDLREFFYFHQKQRRKKNHSRLWYREVAGRV